MTDAEKFKYIVEYVQQKYNKEIVAWEEADKKGDVMSMAKASIRGEILWEIVALIDKLNITALGGERNDWLQNPNTE